MRRLLAVLFVLLAALIPSGRLLASSRPLDSKPDSVSPFREPIVLRTDLKDARVLVNLPAKPDWNLPTTVLLYALPNGNTIEQTVGARRREGVHWRYDIQHIGAQTRLLREAMKERNLVVAYYEANGKSWPAWRREHQDDAAIRASVEGLLADVPGSAPRDLVLAGHSGGGSLQFGFLTAHEELPAYLSRIVFLDSNYNFEGEAHAGRMQRWLAGDPARRLVVLAYDDREVELNGKKVITSPTGGTWRATERMAAALGPLEASELGSYTRWSGPQIELLAHRNPERKILHTALVGERNGLLHAMTLGTALEGKVAQLDGPKVWESLIQEPSVPPESIAQPRELPPRPTGAMSGSAFIDTIKDLPREQREAAVLRELLAGNVPDFLRKPIPITTSAMGLEGTTHTLTMEVMPDYLAIGSDEDFVRMPMNPYTAQAFADAFGYVLPTRHMVNLNWEAADTKIEPRPLTEEREAAVTFLQHDRIIREQIGGAKPRLLGGHKKDVVISNRVQEKPNRVAIYGWHYQNGKPIQPLTIVHVDWYVDYSHGIRPVRRLMTVDGTRVLPYEEILADPHLHNLLSDEGEIRQPRYKDPNPKP